MPAPPPRGEVGQIAADDEFITSQYASIFVNATFGWPDLTSANLPSGGPAYPLATPGVRVKAAFTDALSMYADLAVDDGTRACLAQQIMAYIVTRALASPDDQCVVKSIGTTSVTPTGSFSETISMIVQSRQFLMQTGEAP